MQTYAFIDAANLFYGGEQSLGWKIDYQKLLAYLKEKYRVQTAYYFGGVELHGFPFDCLTQDTVRVEELEEFLLKTLTEKGSTLDEAHIILMGLDSTF